MNQSKSFMRVDLFFMRMDLHKEWFQSNSESGFSGFLAARN